MKTTCKLLDKNQSGVTLVELLVATAVTAVLVPGIVLLFSQLTSASTQSNNRMAVINDLNNTVNWMSKDARNNSNSTARTGFPFRFDWTDVNNITYQAVYNYQGNSIIRSFTQNGTTSNSTIAHYITTTPTPSINNNGTFMITVAASAGTGSRAVSENRTLEIQSRVLR
jgi:prepilin-type N-terminal cleavage/methylation domain-containing protein